MKKLFNASLVALAVAGTFSANAADISVNGDALKISTEAKEVGLKYDGTLTFDTIVKKDHSAGAEIVLSFSENVDLSGVTGGACSGLNSGTFTCNDLTFDVGTGSFTFDAVAVDNTAKTISFNVNLGNPMIANSAFRTSIDNMSIAGSSNLDYASNLGGAEIETGSAVIATEASQYSFAVQTEYNNRVERVNQETFATFAADESDLKDVARVNILDKASEFDVAAFTVDSDIKVSADLHLGDATETAFAISGTTGTAPAPVTVDAKLAGFTSTLTALDATTATVITFTNGSSEQIALTNFAIDAGVEYGNLASAPTETGTKTLAQAANLGKWELDASVVNVPYLPVGYENLSSNVEYSNHGSAAAEVSISAFDNKGNEYTGTLANAAPKTVTKYSEDDIMGALGITEATKLNITFISDADEENVSIVPYYRQGDSRVQSINDQYKK
ncbi:MULTISPECIES: hypothetical protein [unclassified Vibrio]|uniref:hypothetical protein n=1 Tax=unclassified Vibrio TaxID=2614977 RepID=UPI0029654045|nr:MULTISPECIES: hypothetical protein [unclassified Vibrio]MDW2276059.1 hypothetical protein [Vibrio sp. 1074]MDW2287181.1 hypothetical protein [Vibrio sp. 1562]MDW3123409.1 hypothetical protein [Vibrio sp. 1974]